MRIDDKLLKQEETVVLRLRELYRRYGYRCFKMSKFEEYDLYGRNKDFLVSDRVITFTDTNGKLMALKPDVTLSIVKNLRETPGAVQRLYYNENVYRVSDKTHQYKEIMQAGLECIGDLDGYDLCEVVLLAARSLQTIARESVLTLSHLDVVTELMREIPSAAERSALLECIGQKNGHGVAALCAACGTDAETARLLEELTRAYGTPEDVIARLEMLPGSDRILPALEELRRVANQCGAEPGVRVCVDLSLLNDTNYYNGLVLGGYIKGIPSCVLRGGQYDHLMRKMDKKSRAIGFAVYLDALERLCAESDFDVDVLLLYPRGTAASAVQRAVRELTDAGESVAAQTTVPEKLTYRRLVTLEAGEGT